MPHQLHQGGEANAGTDHIRGEGVPETVRVGYLDASGAAMMAKQ
jgi:hypothetical protein